MDLNDLNEQTISPCQNSEDYRREHKPDKDPNFLLVNCQLFAKNLIVIKSGGEL